MKYLALATNYWPVSIVASFAQGAQKIKIITGTTSVITLEQSCSIHDYQETKAKLLF